jgi:hypothetical protein
MRAVRCVRNNTPEQPVNTERLTVLMDSLTNQTVFGQLLAPLTRALVRARSHDVFSRVLSMTDFIALGVQPSTGGSVQWPSIPCVVSVLSIRRKVSAMLMRR